MAEAPVWSVRVPLSEAQRGAAIPLHADAAICARVARLLDLAALDRLDGEVRLARWLDGAELNGRWTAAFAQTCSVTAEPFEQTGEGTFRVRVLPAGSRNAPAEDAEAAADLNLDTDADDPPDVLEREEVDVAAYLVEHFALELDPFPRAPGAEFTPPAEAAEPSPFAALAVLKREG